jgi:hypothetical protein
METKKGLQKLAKEVAREAFGADGRVAFYRTAERVYRWHCAIHHKDDRPHSVLNRTLRDVRIYLNGLSAGLHMARYASRKKALATQ